VSGTNRVRLTKAMPESDGWVPPRTHELAVRDGRVVCYCCYGPPGGLPVVSLAGTPGTRWERPDVISAFEQAGLRVVLPDRPGYGGSTRRPGRSVADEADDVRELADTLGWERFAVTGFSGGGPFALACAALLADRVACCATVASPAPADEPEVDFFRRETPARAEAFRLAVLGEQALRPYLETRARETVARVEAGGPMLLPAPAPAPADADADADAPAPATAAGQSGADRGRVERIRATFLGGLDGWIDDDIALVRPWGFDIAAITGPVSIWYGANDTSTTRTHTDWLLAHVPGAQGFEYPGGHDPGEADFRRILAWIAGASGLTRA
jgi:pimeloyl-ACP methyl ester carboxylesterase